MVTVAFCKKEMAKRSRTPDDKISNLPDEILVQILSSLPTKQVFQTSLLSRRWKHLRRHVPTLHFQHSEPSDDEAEAEDDDQQEEEEEEEQEEDTNMRANFVGFVNKTLTQLLCPNLKKLSLAWTIKYTDDFDHADDWTRFAIKRRVEELTLNVHYWHACCGSRKRYVLPEDVFNMPFLEKLSLEACCVLPRSALCWESLRVLKIKDSVLCSDHVLSKIPMLEYLELTKCTGFSSLSIVQERLRKLVIDHAPVENFGDDEDITEVNWDVAKDFVLDIKSPNIQALEIMGELSTKIILPGNLMSLVDVKLDFCFSPYKFVGKVKEKQDMLRDVLLSLRHAQCLHLGLQCSEILPVSWEKSVPYPVLNCKFLTLEASVKRPFLSGIVGLLQNSPNLEILNIDMRSCDKHQDDVSDCTPGLFEGLVIHPKAIKIIGFDGSRCGLGLSFILALLRSSCAFAKMVIDTWYIHNNDKYYDQLEVAKILLASRRDVTIAFGR